MADVPVGDGDADGLPDAASAPVIVDDYDGGTPIGVDPQWAAAQRNRDAADGRAAAWSRLHGKPDRWGCRSRRTGFAVPRLRPCSGIPGGDENDSERFNSVRARFATLEEELPLTGAVALRPTVDGGIHLIEGIRARAPWYAPALDVLERQFRLGLWSGRDWLGWRPLVLAGDPGTGKSHFARMLADLSSSHCAVLNAGGIDDVRMLAGTARGWRHSQPCWPAMVMSQGRVANPLLIVEEIDKISSDRGAAVLDTLLAMLEPVTARTFYDSCLTADVDLSACCWVLTVNDVDCLPAALRSRVDVVRIDGPAPGDFPLVVDGLLDALAARLGVPHGALPALPARATDLFAAEFARRRSIRILRRRLEDAVAALLPPPARSH